MDGSQIRWNDVYRPTTFHSATQLTAMIPEAFIALEDTARVTVVNPGPGGGGSQTLDFYIVAGNPRPVISATTPAAASTGAGFTLTVNGSDFIPESVVQWNGNDRPTTFVDVVTLTADIPASDVSQPGTAQITVHNPEPGGGPRPRGCSPLPTPSRSP